MNHANAKPDSARLESRFEVFFDGQCPMCKREIDMIRRKDKQGQLILTDIAAPEFSSPGPSMNTLMKQIHGREENGEMVTGVQVFREIYRRLGFRKSVWFSELIGVRQFLNLGYRVFAYLRFQHAKHRMKPEDCDTCHSNT